MRAARRALCRTCKGPVLAGLDYDVAAVEAQADADVLGPQGEALARLQGRRTFALVRRDGHVDLRLRDHWQIAGTPAGARGLGGRQAVVLAEHRCGAEPLPALSTYELNPARPPKETDGPPPF